MYLPPSNVSTTSASSQENQHYRIFNKAWRNEIPNSTSRFSRSANKPDSLSLFFSLSFWLGPQHLQPRLSTRTVLHALITTANHPLRVDLRPAASRRYVLLSLPSVPFHHPFLFIPLLLATLKGRGGDRWRERRLEGTPSIFHSFRRDTNARPWPCTPPDTLSRGEANVDARAAPPSRISSERPSLFVLGIAMGHGWIGCVGHPLMHSVRCNALLAPTFFFFFFGGIESWAEENRY